MKTIALMLIKAYKATLSPLLGTRCRFYPSCSEYSRQAFQKYGMIKGARLTLWRLARCNPWNPGGVVEP